MKLISNFRDYYDFLQGSYGIDPKVIYERICLTAVGDKWKKAGLYKPDYTKPEWGQPDYLDRPTRTVEEAWLAICGKIYCVYIHEKRFYFGHEYEKTGRAEIKTR